MFLQYESFQEVQAAESLEISISRAFEEAFEIELGELFCAIKDLFKRATLYFSVLTNSIIARSAGRWTGLLNEIIASAKFLEIKYA
jgi:hypothetical protein